MTPPTAALIDAAAAALRPFAKRLLAMGVPFGAVARRLRALYIDIAQHDFAVGDRRSTDIRIALVTGINRKDGRFFIGAAVSLQVGTIFTLFGAQSMLGAANAKALARELSPGRVARRSGGTSG